MSQPSQYIRSRTLECFAIINDPTSPAHHIKRSKNEIVTLNEPLAQRLTNAAVERIPPSVASKEDIHQIHLSAMGQAIDSYDPTKGQFTTHSACKMRNALRRYRRDHWPGLSRSEIEIRDSVFVRRARHSQLTGSPIDVADVAYYSVGIPRARWELIVATYANAWLQISA